MVAIAVSFVLSFIYFKTTGRTFNGWDFTKVLFGTALLSLVFYYVFYYLDSFFILLPLKLHKEKINKAQEKFWEENFSTINKNIFFTNLNYELQKLYFESENFKNVIDFDLVDYTTIEKDGDIVRIDVLVREVFVDGGKFKSRLAEKTLRLKRVKREFSLENLGGVALRCKNCGTSMDAFLTECPSCGTRQNYLQEWYLC